MKILISFFLIILLSPFIVLSHDGDEEYGPGDLPLGGDEYATGGAGGGNPLDDYFAQHSFDPLIRITDMKQLEEYLNNTDDPIGGGGVLGLFTSSTKEVEEEFESFAKPLHNKGYRFIISNADILLEKFGVNNFSWKIFVFPSPKYLSNTDDKPKYRFPGTELHSDVGKSALKGFLLEKYLPLVIPLSPAFSNERIFIEKSLPILIVIMKLDEEKDPKGVTYLLNRIRKIASPLKGKMAFTVLKEEEADLTQFFHKKFFIGEDEKNNVSTNVIIGIKDGPYYYSITLDSFNSDMVQEFVNKFFNKGLTPCHIAREEEGFGEEFPRENVEL